MRRPESVIEYVIAYPATLGDAFGLIEGPMNAEINPALAILFFSLRQIRKTARSIRTDVSVIIASLPIEFVGNEGKRDVIGAVETAHDLEECPSKSVMTLRVCRERRRKLRARRDRIWPTYRA